jgi:hypothetical protein
VSGVVANACSASIANSGTMSNSVTNAGALTNSGTISGSLKNNSPCGVVNNTGFLTGVVVNNADLNNNSGGTISGNLTNNSAGTITNAGLIDHPFDNYGIATNTGSITGATTNYSGGSITNNSAGAISGALINDAGGQVSNSGAISGQLTNAGYINNNATGDISGLTTNNVGGTIDNYGFLSNTVTNNGTLNLNGAQMLTGAIVNNGLTNINVEQTINNANFDNNGALSTLNSTANLNLTGGGVYSQASGANFITHVDGLAPGTYSKVISDRPIDIATGAIVTPVLNPALKLNPGDVIPAVIQGQANVGLTNIGDVQVNNISDRYNLLARTGGSNNQNVDLYLPANTGGILQNYDDPGTYFGALEKQTLESISAIQVPTLGVLHQRYAVLNAVSEYDCNKFDKNNVCISF